MEASFELLPIDAAMEIISMLTKIHGKFEHFATKIATNPQRQKAKSPCKSMTYKGFTVLGGADDRFILSPMLSHLVSSAHLSCCLD